MWRRAWLAVFAFAVAQAAFATVAVDFGEARIWRIVESRGERYGVGLDAIYRVREDGLDLVCKTQPFAPVLATNDGVWFIDLGNLIRINDSKPAVFMTRVAHIARAGSHLIVHRGTEILAVQGTELTTIARNVDADGVLETAGERALFMSEREKKTFLTDGTSFRLIAPGACDAHTVRQSVFLMCGDSVYAVDARAGTRTLIRQGGTQSEREEEMKIFAQPPLPKLNAPAEIIGKSVNHAVRNGDFLYVATDDDVFALRGNEQHHVVTLQQLTENEAIMDMRTFHGRVYVAGDSGAFEIVGTTAHRVTTLQMQTMFEHDDRLWMTYAHTLRIDDDVDIVADIVSSESWWKRILDRVLPGRTISAGTVRIEPRYARKSDGRDPYGKSYPRRFFTVLSADREKFERQLSNNEFETASENIVDVDGGVHKLYYAVRDAAGNTFTFEQKLNVIPGPAAGAVIVWLLGALAAVLVLILAPWVSWCQSLVLNPFIQKYGSFGTLKLILSAVPAARRHLLRRYRRELNADLAAAAERFVIPSPELAPDPIEKKLRSGRRLLIKGRSGIGKSAVLRYLASFAARQAYIERVTPIFIPIARYRGKPMDRSIADQLAVYGHLSDRDSELLAWFIDEGPFLICIDGLNEVDAETRMEVRRFVDRHWKRNYFILASQEAYEFDDLPSISLAPLGDDEIRRFLEKRLGLRAAEAIVRAVLAHRDVYGIAQNLEFAIDLIERGQSVPATTTDLYSAILDPIVVSANEGTIERAFDMIRTHDIYIDSPDANLPAGFLGDLRKHKLVIQRDDKSYFTHNLVRDFLASCYLRSNWKSLIPDQTIDTDWRATLDLLARSLDTEELHALLRIVLTKNQMIARELFNAAPLEKRAQWGESFEREYGRAALRVS